MTAAMMDEDGVDGRRCRNCDHPADFHVRSVNIWTGRGACIVCECELMEDLPRLLVRWTGDERRPS